MGGILGTNVQAPPPRNFATELSQTAQGYLKTAPQYYNLEAKYGPLYGQLNLQELAQQMGGYTDASGQYHPGTIGLGSVQRGADVADVMRYGPAATAAFLQANPYLAGSLANLYSRTADSPILSTLNSQAMGALQSGGRLSPQEQRDVEQQTRARFEASGNLMGNQALGSELLNRDAAVRGRMAAAQGFATGVEGLNQGQFQNVGRAAGIFSSTLTDPFQAILGRPGQSSVMQANRLFDPTSPYASDLYNTNYNAQAAANIGNANNNAALWGALIKSIGSVAGTAAASDRRLKKNIKRIGTSPSGIPIHEFQYRAHARNRARDRSPKFIGPLAQEVAKLRPDAVITLKGGMRAIRNPKFVDLSKIDVPFQLAA